MIQELEKLISFKTVVGNHDENDCALKWIKDRIKNYGLFVSEYNSNKFSSIVITTQKTKRPKVFLAAHLDVAKAHDGLFKPAVKGNKLYGRGVFDMKFAIACYLKLLKELKNEITKYDFGIIITTDEECGGENGVKYLLDLAYGCDCVFLPDGSENWKLEVASKGLWSYVIKSNGRSAHPSVPWEADNALENLIDYLCELKRHFKKEPCGDPDHIHCTMDINEFNTGKTGDNLPDYAEAMVDIFFTNEKEYKDLVRIEKNIRKRYKGLKIYNTILNPSIVMPKKNKYADVFYEIAKKKYGIEKKEMFTHGTSDAHYFIKKKIPIIETRPKGGGFHGNNEWVDLKDLERFYEVVKEFVLRTARITNIDSNRELE